MSTPFTEDAGIPVSDPTPFSSYHSVVLPVAGRPVPLQVKVSAPVTGSDLPVILMSHGHGPSNFVSSSRGYGPVVEFWAARGFVVLQPTHLDSTALGLREADDPDAPLYARSRAQDMRRLSDQLLVWAYLRSQLFPGDPACTEAVRALNRMPEPVGAVRST